jgi:hypothetical protein
LVDEALPEKTCQRKEQQNMISNRYHFLRDYPGDCGRFWTEDLQGVTHDRDYWYFTNRTQLWKFPIGFDISTDFDEDNLPSGVIRTGIPGELSAHYNHFNDLDHYAGHLFVPLTYFTDYGGSEPPSGKPVIAVFRAKDLAYLGYHVLELAPDRWTTAWCAVNPINGWLYTSGGYAAKADDPKCCIYVYQVYVSENPPMVDLEPKEPFRIYSEDGGSITLGYDSMQGGAFSEDGQYLYLVSGSDSNYLPENEGISVFNTTSGWRVGRSTNGHEPFNYEWHPGWSAYEEPEGVTVWDLDKDTRAPGIRGQLHVIMLDNDPGTDDDLSFKHYRFEAPSPVLHEKVGLQVVAATSGYVGVFAQSQFQLWERPFRNGWQPWIDHSSPAAIQQISAVAAPSGYVGVFATDAAGQLWEIGGKDGIEGTRWLAHGFAPGDIKVASPVMVAGPSGYIAVFVIGSNGDLYEYYFTGGGAVPWAWTDHIAPPI